MSKVPNKANNKSFAPIATKRKAEEEAPAVEKEEEEQSTPPAVVPKKKGKFQDAPVPASSAVASNGADDEVKEKWSQITMTLQDFVKGLDEEKYFIVDGGKTKYIAYTDTDGSTIKVVKLVFKHRLCPLGMQYFPKTKKINNEGFSISFAITDEEVELLEQKVFPWLRRQVHNDPGFFFEAKSAGAFIGKTWDQNNEFLSQFFGGLIYHKRPNPKKPGEFYSATFKAKVRQDYNPETEQGTQYPVIDIFDLTVNSEEPECIYFHPPNLTKKQKEDKQKGAENKASHRKAIATMLKDHPDRIKVKDLLPPFSYIDIEVDFLGITTLGANWYLSNSAKEVGIVEKSTSTYVAREIGAKPKSKFARAKTEPIEKVGDASAEADNPEVLEQLQHADPDTEMPPLEAAGADDEEQ